VSEEYFSGKIHFRNGGEFFSMMHWGKRKEEVSHEKERGSHRRIHTFRKFCYLSRDVTYVRSTEKGGGKGGGGGGERDSLSS